MHAFIRLGVHAVYFFIKEYGMSNTIDPEKLKKAPLASKCFMGLGQILYLKQYIRGALFAMVEIIMICAIVFGAKKIIPANKSIDDEMQGLPDTVEMIEYLQENDYKKIDRLVDSRTASMKSFVEKKAIKDIEKSYRSAEAAVAKAEKNQAKAQAKLDRAESKGNENKIALAESVLEEADEILEDAEDHFSDLEMIKELADENFAFITYDDISEQIDTIETFVYDTEIGEIVHFYEKLNARYNEKLAKAMVKIADAKYRAEVKSVKSEMKGSSRADIKEALSEIVNDFDENYDGCTLCERAHRHGKRTTIHRAWFQGPIVSSIMGLVTLGSRQPTTVAKYMDHSVFMMINGILALIVMAFFVLLYIINVNSAKTAVKKILKNEKFPTMKEARNDISQNAFATIGIAPSIVMIAIFSLVPLLFSALVAFTNYSSPDHIPPNNLVDWVGIQNFVTMFSTRIGGGEWARTFGITAVWTIIWAIFATFTCFFVGFFYAFVLQDKRVVIPGFFRTVYILPYAIPTMLSLFVWANLLNGTIGPINRTLQMIGLAEQPIPWLSNPNIAKFSLIFVNIWIGFPYSMILTTSSMTAISNSLYEAAVIDGATKWQQFKSITYPLVMFQLKPTLIMQFAGNINNFGAIFFLTGGGPNMPQPGLTTTTNCGSTDLLISWIYKLTMNTPSRYHLASVLSLLVFVVLVPFALYNFTRTKSFREGEV